MVEATFGGVDVVVNKAGFFQPNVPLEEMPLDLRRRHLAVNLDGTFVGCEHGILRMKGRSGGAIVNIGSGMSIKTNATANAYCASNAAVPMTTHTAAASAGRYNNWVNSVLPGATDTKMLMGNLVEGQDAGEFLDYLARQSALRRLATPDDIAHGVLMLADRASGAISGIYLLVYGGNMPGA